jgi:hypothetical protein
MVKTRYVSILLRNKSRGIGVIPILLWLIFLWPIFLWPKLLCVDIPTKNLLKYRSILKIIDFSRTTCHYFNSLLLLRVDISTDQSPYMSILQQTKIPMCRYSYRPKLQCVDIPTDQSSNVSIFLQTKAPMCRYSYQCCGSGRLFSGSGSGFFNLVRPDPDPDPCPHKIVTNFLNYEIFCPQKLCFNHFHEIKVRLHVFLSIHKTF